MGKGLFPVQNLTTLVEEVVMNNLKKIMYGVAVALGSMVIGQAAQAALITEWTLEATAAFVDEEPAAAVTNTGTVLSWGTPANPENQQSHLVLSDQNFVADVNNPTAGSTGVTTVTGLVTNGPAKDAATLTHYNNVITGDSLTSVTIEDSVVMTPTMPAGSSLPAVEFDLFVVFEETLNAEPCANPLGDPCADIYALTNPENLSFSFIIDEYKYTVTLDLGALDNLDADDCASVGLAPGCRGFAAAEDGFTTLQTQVNVTAMRISEPAILGLLGMSLVGIGVMRRRVRS